MKKTIINPLLIIGLYLLGVVCVLVNNSNWFSWLFLICSWSAATTHLIWYNKNYIKILRMDLNLQKEVQEKKE